MTTEKGNFKSVRIAALLLIVAMITTTVISGVFAKYTSAFAGKGDITVAKWNITPSNLGTTTPAQAFDFVTTAYKNVVENKIAPGTAGGFNVGFNYTGTEVALTYTFTLTLPDTFPKDRIIISSGGVPLSPASVGNTYIYTVSGTVEMTNNTSALSGSVTAPFTWVWSFDDTTSSGSHNSRDTELGIAAGSFTGTVDLLVEQQLPSTT